MLSLPKNSNFEQIVVLHGSLYSVQSMRSVLSINLGEIPTVLCSIQVVTKKLPPVRSASVAGLYMLESPNSQEKGEFPDKFNTPPLHAIGGPFKRAQSGDICYGVSQLSPTR